MLNKKWVDLFSNGSKGDNIYDCKKNKVLLIGAGWGALGFINNIDSLKYDVKVLSKNNNFLYTPQLANHSVNANVNNIEKDLTKTFFIDFFEEEVTDVNFEKKNVITNVNKHNYDYIIFAHGAVINTFNVKGVNDYCAFLKTKKDSDELYSKIDKLKENSKIAVIGCGLTGSELIGNLIDKNKFNIIAIDGLKGPLQMFSENNINKTINLWKNNNVEMIFNDFVKKINKDKIYFKNREVKYDLSIWCGGVKISPLSELVNKKLGLVSRRGILVNPYLNFYEKCFAIGDCADSGYPPTAQNAYQQGKYLANRFNNDFKDGKVYDFSEKGKLCYIGDGNSIFENKYISLTGKLGKLLGNAIHFYNKNFK